MTGKEIELLVAGAVFIAITIFVAIKAVYWLIPHGWACDSFWGEHKAPSETGFDGCSATGKCSRCGKGVLQDSQGGWF